MSQNYNPQGYQAYRQQGMPYGGQPGFQQMQPPSASGGMPPGMGGMAGMGGMGGMTGGGAASSVPGMLPLEQSYIENILRLNKGKLVHVFTTFENNNQWNAKEFVGIIEAAGRDHLILSDPQSGKRYLIPMVHLDYVTFEEEVEYEPQFGGGGMATYPPR
jgi:spore germination protein Q